MRQIGYTFLLVLVLALGAPVQAQDEPEGNLGEGLDLFGEGTKLLLEGLRDQLGPALRDLRGAIGELDAYEAPELLPNGDIIIRRKEPLDPDEMPQLDQEEEGIEL